MALRVVLGLYCALCALSLALIAASSWGWFGIEADPLSAVYAFMLAAPWSILLGKFGDNAAFGMAAIIAGMIANVVLIVVIGRVIRGFRSRQN